MDTCKIVRIVAMVVSAISLLIISYFHWRRNQQIMADQKRYIDQLVKNNTADRLSGMVPS
ncbi:hypothetical protein GpSGHVEth119 [Glossina pallidipes salivary gland hypertrophy virus]|uniref:Uncharacterized protein n=1 Tax=Glossina hytrovirus (isolate Glossina pallidipes/Ethiopia/Seibersdorf/-) TaxID=379529 RepID=A0A0Y0GFY3_GHVS|nr:hypothetical protein GpSGHVEth119 [Glossina pallidipes salivary gland hypertrophy virus]